MEICSAYPEVVVEAAGEGHLSFRVRKKTFGYYAFNHHGDGKIAFYCKSSLTDQRRLVREDAETFFVPAYLGARGWVAVRLDLQEVDWNAVSSWRAVLTGRGSGKLAGLVDEDTYERRAHLEKESSLPDSGMESVQVRRRGTTGYGYLLSRVERKSGLPAVIFVSGYSDPGFQAMIGCRLKEMGSYILMG